jgi:hypothetical protein
LRRVGVLGRILAREVHRWGLGARAACTGAAVEVRAVGTGAGGGGGGAQEMFVPQNHVGLVIGRGGETIRRLQDTSGANIQVAKDAAGNEPPGMRKIELMGGLGQVAEAKRMIGELIAQVGPVSPSVLSSRHVPRCANLLMGGWLSCRAFHRRTPVEVVAAA